MSVSDNTAPFTSKGSGGNSERIPDFNPPEKAPDRITVGGVRIPLCGEGTNVEIRKNGIAHLTRQTTFTSRYVANGHRYGNLLRTDVQDGYRTVRVELRDHRTGEFTTVHHGFLGSYGGSERGNIHGQVYDPAQLLPNIGASKQFDDAFLTDVIEYVAETFQENQPIYDEVLISSDAEKKQVYDYRKQDIREPIFDTSFPNVLKKTFKKHRHSLLDVLRWAQDRAKFRFWFQPTTEDSTIVLRVVDIDDLPLVNTQHSGTQLGGEMDVVSNNALYEIQPYNALEVTGGAFASRSPKALDSQYKIEKPPQKAATVTVQHDPLVERVGGQIVAETFNGEFYTEQAIENYARSKLKEKLDESGGGQIVSLLAPDTSIFDTIEARPVAQNFTQEDVPSLTYEVERIIHTTDTNKAMPYSQFDVSFYVDPNEISVSNVEWQTV